jgi:hypothetical protein
MAEVDHYTNLDIVTDGEDNVYYNVKIYNDRVPFDYIRTEFSSTRTQPILERPNDYEVSIIRFKLSAFTIPIQLWPGNNYYTVTLSFGGVDFVQPLEYIPNSFGVPAIWNYQELIDIINIGYEKCFYADYPTNTVLRYPGAPPTQPPFMTYDAKTELVTFYAQTQYDNDSLVPTIGVYYNAAVHTLFPAWHTIYNNGNDAKTYQVQFRDTKTNSVMYNGLPYYTSQQEYSTLYLWGSLNSIVFETSTIPVEPELESSQTNVTRMVITDFEPVVGLSNREAIQYFPQGPLRYYDLKSNFPMRKIDIRVYWEDKSGQTYPVFLGSNDSFSIKILFKKKVNSKF